MLLPPALKPPVIKVLHRKPLFDFEYEETDIFTSLVRLQSQRLLGTSDPKDTIRLKVKGKMKGRCLSH